MMINPEQEGADLQMFDNLEELIQQTQEELLKMLREKHPEIDNQIKELKEKHKELYLYAFSEDEYYFYRPLRRFEYKQLVMNFKDDEEALGEAIVKTGVVFPKLDDDKLNELKAGTVATLLELILAASNFGASAPAIKL